MSSRSLPLLPLALALALALLPAAPAGAAPADRPGGFPNILIVTVDTLRADRLSGYGYERPTSPAVDALMAAGVRFDQARTSEPLTAPSLASMITTLDPHEHGSTRNGLAVREGLPSFTKILSRRGYRTAAFVGNWTLRDELSGLAEHFDEFHEVLTRQRWFLVRREADARDLTDAAVEWLEADREARGDRPFLLWVHYVEPHAPYRLHEEHAADLGIDPRSAGPADRYDTEIAFVDRSVGRLLGDVDRLDAVDPTIVVFTSDHGESLGEHDYWGHGRHLYEPTLRVPLSITWRGRIDPGVVGAPALILDLPATLFGLAGFPVPTVFQGFDWSPVLRGEAEAPSDRATLHQAHRGAVQGSENPEDLRRRGLLEVARIAGGVKETLRVKSDRRWLFDLAADPLEKRSQVSPGSPASDELAIWLDEVRSGLVLSDDLPPPVLGEEDLKELEALGYLD